MSAPETQRTEDTATGTTKHTTGTTKTRSFREFVVVAVVAVVTIVVSLVTPAAAQDVEKIAEIRVHGNHSTPDADVIQYSGLKVGDPADEATLQKAERSITVLHRFTSAEVRKRFLSISDPSQVLVIIVVDEKAGVDDTHLEPTFGRRLRAAGMFLPILNYQDGYGLTYGVRTTWPHAIGDSTRVSVPLSWGGERRAGVEVDHWFGGSRGVYGIGRKDPQVRLIGGVSLYRRVNPHYEMSDYRQEAKVRVEKPVGTWLRAGAAVKTARVAWAVPDLDLPPETLAIAIFPARTEERHDSFVADVVIDTRLDPSFPRNAIYASFGREQLRWTGDEVHILGGDTLGSAGRWLSDMRGYAALGGNAVVALRSQFVTSNTHLPFSEQPLLGGTDTLRGYDAGYGAGDNLATVSTELRYLLTSPLNVGKFGVKGFVDWGTVWNAGSAFKDAQWQRGIGGGVFFGAGPVLLDFATAWAQDGSARVNFGLGVSF